MIYATVTDLSTRLGRELSATETARADALLVDASALIDVYAANRGALVDSVAARGVCCQMVIRVFDAPSGGISQETVGGVSRSYVVGEQTQMMLTDVEKFLLCGGFGRVRSVPMAHSHDWSDAWLVP